MSRDQQVLDEQFDTVVVGSGIGGLSAGSLLAQLAGQRVLVLEQHFELGGFTQVFHRPVHLGTGGGPGQYSWDVGVHYVGRMWPAAQERRVFDLVTGGRVSWNRLPDRFDVFHFPDLTVGVPSDPRRYRHELHELFPHQTGPIDRWFDDLDRASGWMHRAAAATVMPGPVGRLMERPGRAGATRTVTAALDEVGIVDRRLRAVLTAQWGTYGIPPSRAPLALHALIATHYAHGAWFPAGGADTITRAVRRVIEDAGGACLVDHEVTDILLDDDGRARGVRVLTGDGPVDVPASRVVSDAGTAVTYQRLLPDLGLPQQRPAPAPAEPPATTVTAYLGLRQDPRTLPSTEGANHYLFGGYDHDETYARRSSLLDGDTDSAFVSFGSVRAGVDGPHTAQVMTFSDFAPFQRWADGKWRRRGSDYDQLKVRMGEGLVRLADEHLPGLADLVDYVEVATPLTVTTMTGHLRGAIYGVPVTPGALRHGRPGPTTPVPGLTLAGADVAYHGVVGAMMGGAFGAASILGSTGFPRILRAAARAPQDVDQQRQEGSRPPPPSG